MFTLPPRDSTLQYKRCVQLWNNSPYITPLIAPSFYSISPWFPQLGQINRTVQYYILLEHTCISFRLFGHNCSKLCTAVAFNKDFDYSGPQTTNHKLKLSNQNIFVTWWCIFYNWLYVLWLNFFEKITFEILPLQWFYT